MWKSKVLFLIATIIVIFFNNAYAKEKILIPAVISYVDLDMEYSQLQKQDPKAFEIVGKGKEEGIIAVFDYINESVYLVVYLKFL
ncbi:hypothetical protein WDW89_01600 [Deltaproteobacteria bacterium TL4]